MSDQGQEEEPPTTKLSMVTTTTARLENSGEDRMINSFDGICTTKQVQALAIASTVEEKERKKLEQLMELEMELYTELDTELEMELDTQLGDLVEENLVGTENRSSELQEASEELLSYKNSEDEKSSRKQNDRIEFNLREYCGMLYDQAGSLVKEPEEQITLEKYSHLLNDKVNVHLNQVLDEHPLPFVLQDFQKISIHLLASGHNVVLMSPTGSGKMVVVYLAILVLEKANAQSGVGVGTQPLNSIMQEKLRKPYLTTGVISMKGDVQSSTDCGEQEDDVVLTDPLEDFKSGRIKCLLGHAESWNSGTAQEILDSLQEKDKILLTFVDEAHIILSSHWESFRHQLKQVPGLLRGRARRGAPCLAMTATLTPGEIKELETCLGFRTNTVVLRANPIQEHHKYIRYAANL